MRGSSVVGHRRLRAYVYFAALAALLAAALSSVASGASGGAGVGSGGTTTTGTPPAGNDEGQPVRRARDVDLGAPELKRRRPGLDRRQSPAQRHRDADDQEWRRHRNVVAVQPAAGLDAASRWLSCLRVAVRVWRASRRRGAGRRRRCLRRRRLPADRRRERVRGQVRPRADLREDAARADRQHVPGRARRVPVHRLPSRRSRTRCFSARAGRSSTSRRCTGTTLARRSTGSSPTPTTSTGIYGRPISPLGQIYNSPPARDIRRFRQLSRSYAAPGVSWWDWQEGSGSAWHATSQPIGWLSNFSPDTSLATLAPKAQGDVVVWAQEHLSAPVRTSRSTAPLVPRRRPRCSCSRPLTGFR